MIRVIAVCLIVSSTHASSQTREYLPNLPRLYDVTQVAADDTLNIREQPNTTSPVIGQLDPDTRSVEIVGYSNDGNWALLNHGERAGWVSTNFITVSELPLWSEFTSPLSCYGTEPFWNLEIASTVIAMFQLAGGDKITLTRGWLAESWGRSDWGKPVNGALSFTSTNGPAFASFRSEQCNDGMSDQEFHLSVTFVKRNGPAVTGCCRLKAP